MKPTILALALVLMSSVAQAQLVVEGEATLGRVRLHWKITEQWWDGPAHCVRYETAISGVDEVYFALERVYVDGSVDAVSMFGDRFPHEMLEDFNAALYPENTAVQSVVYNESWIHPLAVQSEPRETAIAPENFLPELEQLLRRHIREIEKHIPKDPSGDLEGV
jgi:hypothetical protein